MGKNLGDRARSGKHPPSAFCNSMSLLIVPLILVFFWETIKYCSLRMYSARIAFVHSNLANLSEIFFQSELRWGWVFFERTRILSGIQFITYFIEIFVMETKRFVGSFVHVILTRQTCGQRSSGAAESKRRAIGTYFSERICYMFLISKCRRDRDLGLCPTSVLAFREPQRHRKIRKKNVFWRRKNRILPLRCVSPNANTEVVHSPRPQSPLHFDIRNI